MATYDVANLGELLKNNEYPGRGIVIGKSEDGRSIAIAYFIMGRSANSRNRVFTEDGDTVTIYPADSSKVEDPSLIIYSPIRKIGDNLIVTNGDQTDTIFENMDQGDTFEESLRNREFEPDAPNYTPRISGVLHIEGGYTYEMSILKSNNCDPDQCLRFAFSYDNPYAGEGHFIHTYMGDGNPLPSYEGEPTPVTIPTDDLDEFTDIVWKAINEDNKVSLFTRFIDIETGKYETRIVNKNK